MVVVVVSGLLYYHSIPVISSFFLAVYSDNGIVKPFGEPLDQSFSQRMLNGTLGCNEVP